VLPHASGLLVGGEGFAVDASLIEADANKGLQCTNWLVAKCLAAD
jgi:hypothetical protein